MVVTVSVHWHYAPVSIDVLVALALSQRTLKHHHLGMTIHVHVRIQHVDVLVRAVIVADILGEEVILKWYRESASSKGKRVFLEQMKKFVEWLENAEEGQSLNVTRTHALAQLAAYDTRCIGVEHWNCAVCFSDRNARLLLD